MEWVMRKIGICWIDIVLLCVRLNLFSSGASSQDHPTSHYVALSTFCTKGTPFSFSNKYFRDYHQDRHRPGLFHIQPGCRKLWNFQWVQKPSKFWSSMYWLIHDKCISFARICKIATKKKSCYQQKGKKLQKIYLCTLVEATKIGNKKMKKMSTKRVNCNKSWNHDIIAFVLTKYFSLFQKRSDEGCSIDLR